MICVNVQDLVHFLLLLDARKLIRVLKGVSVPGIFMGKSNY